MSPEEALDLDLLQRRVAALNNKYHSLTIDERIRQLYIDFPADKVMITSSFAATSALLLHIFSKIVPTQKIFFIDTGYHFPETLEYKKKLTELFNLDVHDIKAEEWKHEFTQNEQTYKIDPDLCCSINKVEPLDAIKKDYDIWVSGLMRWQSDYRATLDIFEQRNGIMKFYPLIDASKKQRDDYIKDHNLPFHPLVAKGYTSIGCKHCTLPGDDRSGRWNNFPKTECGIHL